MRDKPWEQQEQRRDKVKDLRSQERLSKTTVELIIGGDRIRQEEVFGKELQEGGT